MKVSNPDAFILNLKIISNDLAKLEWTAERARNASSNDEDYQMGDELISSLREIRHSLRDRLLEDIC